MSTRGWRELKTVDGQTYFHNTITDATTWDRPPELMSQADLASEGEYYWIPHPEHAYVPGTITQRGLPGGEMMFRTVDGQTYRGSYARGEEPIRINSLALLQKHTDDLVKLDQVNSPSIIHNMRLRAKEFLIYTNVGDILISINPYKRLPLYTPEVVEQYQYGDPLKLPPHPYSIADACYKNIIKEEQNQSVIISGESGAGKTEATKIILQYLAEVAGSVSGVEQKMLVANPVLESFGNAKTVRNNNSSRFGKWMEVHFDRSSRICGCRIVNYLLEKCRVVLQGPNERNYHIFYQLLAGASPDLKRRLYFTPNACRPEHFHYLNQSGCMTVDQIDDASDFREMEEAMSKLEFAPDEKAELLQVISGVLHLGNISFRPEKDDTECSIADPAVLNVVATLLRVNPDSLSRALRFTQFQSGGRGSVYTCPLSVAKAGESRDSLAKHIYGRVFDWLVQRVNTALRGGDPGGPPRIIGVLDIFGFEIFQHNSFEQLCINYTNEKLQQHFNMHTFKLEEEVYRNEQVRFTHVEFIDNQQCLDLIERPPIGVLPSLDEECIMPNGSDGGFLQKLHNKHKDNVRYKPDLRSREVFNITHYAGQVPYDSTGFMEKNKDTLVEGLLEVVESSASPLIRTCFPPTVAAQGIGSGGRTKKVSLGRQFQQQLNALMETLNSTEPHYIRCVKPNHHKLPVAESFDGMLSIQQLLYAGVMEAVRIRQTGYPFRLPHLAFYKHYRLLIPGSPRDPGPRVRDACANMLNTLRAKHDLADVQVGTTMVLYRARQQRVLELLRNVIIDRATTRIQSVVRGRQVRLMAKRLFPIRLELRYGIYERDIDRMQRALTLSDEERFQIYEATYAKDLMIVMREEERCLNLVRSVMRIVGDQLDFPDDTAEPVRSLRHAVDTCKAINFPGSTLMQHPEVTTAIDRFQQIVLRVLARKRAAAGSRSKDDCLTAEALERTIEEQLVHIPDRPLLEASVAAGNAIYLDSPSFDRLKALVCLPEEELNKRQLQAASTTNNRERKIEMSIKMKEHFFRNFGNSFNLSQCPILKTPQEFVKGKMFGKDNLKAGMMFWTKSSIHTSLTRLPDPKLDKLAVNNFKNILGFMGDKSSPTPHILAHKVLTVGLESPALRDEIYIQIIKQLTQNPSRDSTTKGFKLIELCLPVFPPSDAFENFLEIFFREKGADASRLRPLLHESMYHVGARVVPSPSELEARCRS
eukprot:gnl/Spiro4/8126_TR4286_c0_g1_i1.p1 gnl/Spiro4/8126_TR4286_c0_g1~~gnl/Spiro4/8126_TR4286_c0_g1_i1.p1  ORF type:complete len:1210 (+),score=449.32 gnl/Spiro4/8126_TR4286_c0_g1_i1:55-3684(+)